METKMILQDGQKLSVRKVLLAIIGGFITIEIFRNAISFALQSRYGIDTDVYYMGRVQFSFIIILTIIISSFIGGFFAGSIAKKKGWLFGILVVVIPTSLVATFILLSLVGKSLTPSGHIWLQRSILDGGIWVAIQLIPCLLGGIAGEKMAKRELQELLSYKGYGFDNNLETSGLIDFYFGANWRLLFTIPFLALCLYLFVYYVGDASLLFRWATIGAIYILIHPSLWLFWYIFPIWEFLFGLLFTAIMLPLYVPLWIYEVANKQISRGKKVFQLVALVLAIVFSTSLASWLGHKPIIWSLNNVTSRGVSVWPILLDKETAPLTYHRLAVFHKEIGEKEKSAKEFEKAYVAYCKLGEYLIRKRSYFDAIEAYNRAISIYPEKSDPHYKLGITYYMVGEYESAISEYNKSLINYPNSFAINVNLALAYEKTNNDKAVEQWKKCLNIAKFSSIPEEITSWIYDYIYNPDKVGLTPQMESYFNKLKLED
jgi:tetratricopeptide (TPR) repeat protein